MDYNTFFPKLSELQFSQLQKLEELYLDWNQKINVISRKDTENITTRHILHSMGVAKYIQFKPNTKILDLGTGGGLPGIPLAIMFPACEFTLIDGRKKKITVVQDIVDQLELTNVKAQAIRSEELKGTYDFVVSRGVTALEKLIPMCQKFIKPKESFHGTPNGMLCLKGGNIKKEIKEAGRGIYTETVLLKDYFDDSFFDEKYLVYVQG